MRSICRIHASFGEHHVGAGDGEQPNHRHRSVPKHRSRPKTARCRRRGGCDLGHVQNFCQSKLTAGLCVATAIALLVAPSIMTQMFVLIAAGFVGMRYLKKDSAPSAEPFKPSITPLALFAVLYSAYR